MSERLSAEYRQRKLAEARRELLRLIIENEAIRKMRRLRELMANQASP